jgi:Uma2 family endonuclease
LRIPVRALTLAGFREWATSPDFPEQCRATFVDEEIILDMSNEDPETHVVIKGVITIALGTLNRELDLGRFYPDGVLISNEAAGVSNNSDASLLLWESLEQGRVRLVPRPHKKERFKEIEGTPDWVLEVLSDSSVEKDTELLRRAYHRAGIREYWLIDVRGEEIVFQILIWRKKGYVPAPNRDGWQRSQVFGREFRLVRKRTRLDLWDYALEVRAD